MWEPVLCAFSISVVLLTLSAWINGRSIKRYMGELIKEELQFSRELIEKESKASRELMERLITKLSDQHESTKVLSEIARPAKRMFLPLFLSLFQ